MLALKGTIVCTQPMGSGKDHVRIEIRDNDAVTVAVIATLTLENFARAISSRVVDCEFQFNNTGTVGTVRETKQVCIERQWPLGAPDEEIRRTIDKQLGDQTLKDGWTYYMKDATNHHNYIPNTNEVRIRLSRQVAREGPS